MEPQTLGTLLTHNLDPPAWSLYKASFDKFDAKMTVSIEFFSPEDIKREREFIIFSMCGPITSSRDFSINASKILKICLVSAVKWECISWSISERTFALILTEIYGTVTFSKFSIWRPSRFSGFDNVSLLDPSITFDRLIASTTGLQLLNNDRTNLLDSLITVEDRRDLKTFSRQSWALLLTWSKEQEN